MEVTIELGHVITVIAIVVTFGMYSWLESL